MAELTGSEILAKSLRNEGTDVLFFLMGGPMLLAESSCIKEGIRPLDVRHEQSAAFMSQAYSRLLQKPSVCMAASGPGVINLTTGIANALIDCCPVVAVGGSSPISQNGRQVFQEIDQLAIMKPCTKWADRVYNLKRIPEQVNFAFQKAMSGKPGPVYLDFPGDVLYAKIAEEQVDWSLSGRPLLNARPLGDPEKIDALVDTIAQARQPIILSGSGVIWSKASQELQEFVEKTGIPFYTTPQGRGVVADDHEYSYLTMRSAAFRDADLIIVVGTRMNYIIGHAAPPASTVAPRSHASISMPTKSPPRRAGSISVSSATVRRCSASSSRPAPSASMRIISPHGGERCQTAKQQSARRRAQTSRWTRRRFIRCDCATRSRILCSATPSWWSTGKKS